MQSSPDTSASPNISLETHLVLALRPLIPILDPTLSSQLAQYLSDSISDTIPYEVLQSVSRWSRSPSGTNALRSSSPPLDPSSYSMIALLAGTKTSPERKFGAYVPPQEPEQVIAQKKRERKALTTIINGVLSVIGAGAAAWIGSERTAWKHEWRVLFALFVAVIVAFSETVLYIIWQSRDSTSPKTRTVLRKYIRAKKEDGGDENVDDIVNEQAPADGLRLRVQATPESDS